MQYKTDPEAQANREKWEKLAATSPQLARVLWQTIGWATGMEILFKRRPDPSLSIEDLKVFDRFGTPERILKECWVHGDELARQVEKAKLEQYKASQQLKSKMGKNPKR